MCATKRERAKDTDFLEALLKAPSLHHALRVDSNFNDIAAVKYESDLARALVLAFTDPSADTLMEPIRRVSQTLFRTWIAPVMHHYEAAVRHGDVPAATDVTCYHKLEELFDVEGSQHGRRAVADERSLSQWLGDTLASTDNSVFPTHVGFICHFGKEFVFARLDEFRDRLIAVHGWPHDITDQELRIASLIPKDLFYTERGERARIVLRNKPARLTGATQDARRYVYHFGTYDGCEAHRSTLFDTRDPTGHYAGSTGQIGPGGTKGNIYTREARDRYNLPMNCGFSSSVVSIVRGALLAGIPRDSDEMELIKTAAIAYVVNAGHHSWHEAAKVANAFGRPGYTERDLTSAICPQAKAYAKADLDRIAQAYRVRVGPQGFRRVHVRRRAHGHG